MCRLSQLGSKCGIDLAKGDEAKGCAEQDAAAAVHSLALSFRRD